MGIGDEVGVGKAPGLTVALGGLFAAGVTPIFIPHRNKARFIFLADESIRQDAHCVLPLQSLEMAINRYEVQTPLYVRRDITELVDHVHTREFDVVRESVADHPAYLAIAAPCAPVACEFVPLPPSPPLRAVLADAPCEFRPSTPPLHRTIHTDVTHVVQRAVGPCEIVHRTEIIPAGYASHHVDTPVSCVRSGHQVWSQSRQINVFDVIETNHTMILGGLMGFVAAGGVALGVGLLGHSRWNVTSQRKIAGRESAYLAPQLDAPHSLREVQAWPDKYTAITWSQLRGIKIVTGLYSVAHVGATADIEGIWEHTVTREIKQINPASPDAEVIVISLLLKKQGRLKATAGVVPFFGRNKDLYHSAESNRISFKFINVSGQPALAEILNTLIEGRDSESIARARDACHFFAGRGYTPENAPISFISEVNRDDHESRDRLRARLPLIADKDKVKKERDREETRVINVGGKEYTQFILISEIIRTKAMQYPIETPLRSGSDRIYPARTGIDPACRHRVRWPLDYRNSNFHVITQVRDTKHGEISAPYEVMSARYIWNFMDNYISHAKFLDILKNIGRDTGLAPVLFQSFNLPEFRGPLRRVDDRRETMQMSLEIHLKESDKQQVFINILQTDFVRAVVSLFEAYTRHPRADYLHLADKYSSISEAFRIIRADVRKDAQHVVEKAQEYHAKIKSGTRRGFVAMLRDERSELSELERMHFVRDLLDLIKVNPFVFLSALNKTTPNSVFEMRGTSVNLERVIDVSLAKSIMENNASVPEIYMAPIPDAEHEHQRELTAASHEDHFFA